MDSIPLPEVPQVPGLVELGKIKQFGHTILKNPDAFPASDLGLLKSLHYPDRISPAELSRHAKRWRPWRAYAALLLWTSLSGSGG